MQTLTETYLLRFTSIVRQALRTECLLIPRTHDSNPRLVAVAAAVALASTTVAAAEEPIVVRIEVSGTAIHATLFDGSVRQGMDLVGAVLIFDIKGAPVRVRIAAVMADPMDKSGTVLLHDFRIEGADAPLCQPGPDGKRLGFPLAGRTAPDGRFLVGEAGSFELVCTAGAQGKCVRFGYHPWETAPDGRPMRDYFNACVRLVRADYCGDGRGWTRDGTLVDLWDRLAIQTSDTRSNPTYSFEAGWTPQGAVCVARTRVPENISLDELKASCPRLATDSVCDEELARAAGALIFNRSQ